MRTKELPLVSVVMPVHNGERFLRDAVASIFAQTWPNLELISVNDGSTDRTGEILAELAAGQPAERLRVLNLPKVGFARALNKGFASATGEYVARMDADDIALPERIATQVAFLEAHPQHVLCGSAIQTFGDCFPGVVGFPQDHEAIRCCLFWTCCFCHPSVLMRRAPFAAGLCAYREEYGVVADYDLWTQLVEVGQVANVPQVLLRYRRHASQASKTDTSTTDGQVEMVWLRQVRLLLPCEGSAAELHCSLAAGRFGLSEEYRDRARRWLEELDRANQANRLYDRQLFRQQLCHLWYKLCRHRAKHGVFRPKEYLAIAQPLRSWQLAARLVYHYYRGAA